MRSHLVERFWGPSELTIWEWIGSINTSAFIRTGRLVGLGSGLGDNLRWLTEPPVMALS